MKFKLTKSSSDTDNLAEIDLDTLEQLLDWVKRHGDPVIISYNGNDDGEWQLEVYDDYSD